MDCCQIKLGLGRGRWIVVRIMLVDEVIVEC